MKIFGEITLKRKAEESDAPSCKSPRIEGAAGCAGQHEGTCSVAPIAHDATADSEHH